MNALPLTRSTRRGSALITVVFLIGIMALLTASMLIYSTGERRSNERHRLMLRARNMSENISAYAAEQITTKLYRLRSFTPIAYMTGVNQTYLPPNSVLDSLFTSNSVGMEVRAGLTGSTGYTFIDPATNPNNANAGLQVNTSTIPIIAKATATHPSIGSIAAYTEYDLEADMVPLFQFAVFYNMDMEFGPGADMIISGPIHTNGNLIARNQTGNSTSILQFTDRVSAAGGFFADTGYKGPLYNENGTADTGPGGTGPLRLQNTAGTVTDIRSGALWRDHKYGNSAVSTSSLANFKTFASSTYGVNFRTSVHGVTPLVLPGVSNYKETNDPDTAGDDRDNGRQIIEPAAATDTAQLKETKFARRAGLYIIVNPDDEVRTGVLPNATTVSMRARSYRCWLNKVNADLTHTLSEVILPGQPSYGALNANINNLPNAYRADTAVRHNQVLRMIQGGGVDQVDTGYAAGSAAPTMASFADAFFWDLRRANNNRGGAPFERATYPYAPRPIVKVDFDLTRFKMAVERTINSASTSTVYYSARPTDATTWGNFIFNASATAAAHGLGIGAAFDTFPAVAPLHAINLTQAAVYAPTEIQIGGVSRSVNAASAAYAARFIVADSTDGSTYTDRYTSSTDESSFVYTPSSGKTHLRVRLYLAGAAPTAARLCDEEIIPIVSDTTTTVTSALTNDYHVVPTSSTGTTPIYTDAITEMRVYVGGIDDTANWTYTAAVSSVTGAFGSGPNANRYTVSALSANTGTVTITATKGVTTTTKVFSLAKQSSIAAIAAPAQEGRWITIGKQGGADPFKMYFAPADPNDALIKSNPSSFAVAATDLINTASASPWFDGITVYVHSVDAEVRAQTSGAPNRIDSGVRLWNGRGSVISLDGTTYPGRTGFSFATNDAAYLVGHFNADGTINSTSTDTANPGGYSARYPEATSERLTSVMADAITILSQPTFNTSYQQTGGWSDSLSAHRKDNAAAYTTSWSTTDPDGSTNRRDGVNTSFVPAAMPFMGNTVAGSGTATTYKLPPSSTEISTAMLMGIVPTNHNPTGLTDGAPSSGANNQSSGGVHNFPRLSEHWNGTGLYIRGSMVAMFESRVAMEPWTLRPYTAAGRFWGLHQSLRNVNHDLPLEPVLLNARRVRFRELTASQYNALKTTIEALPH
ncbi:hypothetical protein [Horticoccus sp. 23ND18S-11]|uniref:hypothetical protein n=1 Tax=Horticoccus sp. 23ND18S-11 TaxID=3391832 RepID=UPI0039C9EC29